ncbi:MAG: NAD-dependent deacetylase [Spirochaetes bacterium]|jgi:NAD-dependent SIR2 family protein deacetylase|nr:NAD-dependent deacetylase [Spirochaetota bacterium]
MSVGQSIIKAALAVREANALLITAGAGMGVDSGLPDFRGKEGFWKAYPVVAKLGLSFSEMANPEWFLRDPKLAWAFYGHRLNLYRETNPHNGFAKLLSAAESKKAGYFVFTSNVDGHFQKSGFDKDRIEECHGSIHYLQCGIPCCNDIWEAADAGVKIDLEKFTALEPLPMCIRCGGIARPNVLMFGDWSWISVRTDIQSTRMSEWLGGIGRASYKFAVIEIGAGKAVPAVRHFSEQAAMHLKGTLIRINPRDYDVPAGHISIPLGGAEGIERIIERMI